MTELQSWHRSVPEKKCSTAEGTFSSSNPKIRKSGDAKLVILKFLLGDTKIGNCINCKISERHRVENNQQQNLGLHLNEPNQN